MSREEAGEEHTEKSRDEFIERSVRDERGVAAEVVVTAELGKCPAQWDP